MKIMNLTLAFLFFSTITFAMGPEESILCGGWIDHCYANPKRFNVNFEKLEELKYMIREYHQNETPISLAVACGSKEIPNKIIDLFESKEPAKEQWIGLDLLLTDEDDRGGPHIRMDATNEIHWKQVVQYFKDNNVKVNTVAFTAFAPPVNSDTLRKDIMSIVKEGGRLIFPGRFAIDGHMFNKSADCEYTGIFPVVLNGYTIKKLNHVDAFMTALTNYHIKQNSGYFENEQALKEHIMGWDGMKAITDDAERRLAAKVFANRIMCFRIEYVRNILEHRMIPEDFNELFSKNYKELSRDYIAFYREYMAEIGFDPTSYMIYTKDPELAELCKIEEYFYPQDGTFDLAGYGSPSLVITKLD